MVGALKVKEVLVCGFEFKGRWRRYLYLEAVAMLAQWAVNDCKANQKKASSEQVSLHYESH